MALRTFASRSFALVAFESLFILAAVAAAAWLRLGSEAWEQLGHGGAVGKAILIAVVCQLCLYYNELYDLRLLADRRELFVRILQALGSTSLVLAVLYYWFPGLVIGRGVFAISSGMVISFVVALARGVRVGQPICPAARADPSRRHQPGDRQPGEGALRSPRAAWRRDRGVRRQRFGTGRRVIVQSHESSAL